MRGAMSAPCPRHRLGVPARRDDAAAGITQGVASGTIPALFVFRRPTRAARRSPQPGGERDDQPHLTVCTSGNSHPQNPHRHRAGRAAGTEPG